MLLLEDGEEYPMLLLLLLEEVAAAAAALGRTTPIVEVPLLLLEKRPKPLLMLLPPPTTLLLLSNSMPWKKLLLLLLMLLLQSDPFVLKSLLMLPLIPLELSPRCPISVMSVTSSNSSLMSRTISDEDDKQWAFVELLLIPLLVDQFNLMGLPSLLEQRLPAIVSARKPLLVILDG